MPISLDGGRHQAGYDVRTGHGEACPYRAYNDDWNDGVVYVRVHGHDHVLHGIGFHRWGNGVHHDCGCGHRGRRRRNSFVGTWVVRRIHHYRAYHSRSWVPGSGWVSSSPWREGNHEHHSLSTDGLNHLRAPSHALDMMLVNQYPSDQDVLDGIVFPFDANCWVQDDHRHLEILVDDHIPTTFFSPLLSMANLDEIHPLMNPSPPSYHDSVRIVSFVELQLIGYRILW